MTQTPASMPGPHAPDPGNSAPDGGGLTVGDIRRELEGLPDDAPLFVTVPGGYDLPITAAWGGSQIIFPADAERGPDGHWPTRPGLELHADPEWPDDEVESVQRSVGTALVNEVTRGAWDLSYRLRNALNLIRLPEKHEPSTSAPDDAAERLDAADWRESCNRALDLLATTKVAVRSDIHHLIQPVIGHLRMFTEGDWETPNREHMEGWIERLRVALAVVDALGDDEARAALASKCGLGYATTAEAEQRNTAELRRILSGDSLPDGSGEPK